ncbi:Dps family protein [Helicobacter anatolicus]|uniref:Dps family protein n=1 Tax=Helicobacter anatolicus TaxID=2905874 RepID=UPI001E430836|nr:Dps family protein [Helicobacter anatolicus]MCE3039602.1 DNA starvation/stationary phase protection protein [Helicobacter anatolicus]
MNKTIELLRQLQADSLVLFMKIHNFHWNVKGSDFYQVHSATEAIYGEFATMFDDLAELVAQMGEVPVITLSEALQVAKIKEESKKSFTSKEVFAAIAQDYTYLLENFKKLSQFADENNDKPVANYADEKISSLQKSLWMLKAAQA